MMVLGRFIKTQRVQVSSYSTYIDPEVGPPLRSRSIPYSYTDPLGHWVLGP